MVIIVTVITKNMIVITLVERILQDNQSDYHDNHVHRENLVIERSPNEEISESVCVNIGARQAVPGAETIISFFMAMMMIMTMNKMMIKIMRSR